MFVTETVAVKNIMKSFVTQEVIPQKLPFPNLSNPKAQNFRFPTLALLLFYV